MKKSAALILGIVLMFAITLIGCEGKKTGEDGGSSANGQIQDVKKLTIAELDKAWADATFFSEGLCAVKDKETGLWGYVDKTGEYKIQPTYYEAQAFSEGFAAVKNSSGLYDFIDKTGKVAFGGFESINKRVQEAYVNRYNGFLNGYALVTKGDENYIVGKDGNEVKTEIKIDNSQAWDYRIQKGVFISYMRSDEPFKICDNQYREIANYSADLEGIYSVHNRLLFNISTKYLLADDGGETGNKVGMFIIGTDGKVVMDQNKLTGTDFTSDYKFGISDDYIIVIRNMNGVQTSAVYDYSGNVVMDYKYKDIAPYSKDIFIAQNNAGVVSVVKQDGTDLLSSFLGLTYSSDLMSLLSSVKRVSCGMNTGERTGLITFKMEDKIKHFDFISGKMIDGIFTEEYLSEKEFINYKDQIGTQIKLFPAVFESPSGIFYGLANTSSGATGWSTSKTVLFNKNGKEIGELEFALGDPISGMSDEYYNTLKNEGICIKNKADNSGKTFLVFK